MNFTHMQINCTVSIIKDLKTVNSKEEVFYMLQQKEKELMQTAQDLVKNARQHAQALATKEQEHAAVVKQKEMEYKERTRGIRNDILLRRQQPVPLRGCECPVLRSELELDSAREAEDAEHRQGELPSTCETTPGCERGAGIATASGYEGGNLNKYAREAADLPRAVAEDDYEEDGDRCNDAARRLGRRAISPPLALAPSTRPAIGIFEIKGEAERHVGVTIREALLCA